MKRNLKRAAVYGVAGLATAAIGASTASALAEDGQENHDVKPAQAAPQAAPAPRQAPPAAAAPQARIAEPQHTVDGPKKPEPQHVAPAAAHRPAVAAARPVLPKQSTAKHAKSSPRTRSSAVQKKVDAATTRYVVRAAVQAPKPVVEKQAVVGNQALDDAVKAVGVAHQAVQDAEKTFDEAGKALTKAKDTLGKTKTDLKKIRDGLKTKKGPCADAPVHKTDNVKRTHSKHGNVVSKTASVSSGGVSASSTATAVNGTVSADAW
jgi:hypothetical protein